MTHVVNTEVIKSPGDFDFLLGIKEGVGELLALTQGALNDLEAGDVAQEIGNTDVVAVRVARLCGVRVLASLDASEAGVFTYSWDQHGELIVRICRLEFLPLAPLAPLVCPLGSGSAPGHILCVDSGVEGLKEWRVGCSDDSTRRICKSRVN